VEDRHRLINVLRQEKNWSSQHILGELRGKNWARTSWCRFD